MNSVEVTAGFQSW